MLAAEPKSSDTSMTATGWISEPRWHSCKAQGTWCEGLRPRRKAVPGPTGESLFLDTADVAHDAAITVVPSSAGGARRIRCQGQRHRGVDNAAIGEDAVVSDSVIGRGAVVGARTVCAVSSWATTR